MHGLIRADRWFTWPGVALILIGGLGAALIGGLKLLAVGWIAWSIGLFTLSGVVFAMSLAPLQRRIVQAAAMSNPDMAALKAMLHRWHVVGWVSVAPLWLAMAAMTLKWPA
jgi:hypothetical protein